LALQRIFGSFVPAVRRTGCLARGIELGGLAQPERRFVGELDGRALVKVLRRAQQRLGRAGAAARMVGHE